MNARRTLAKLHRVGRRAGDQRERHDRDRRDQLRRQRHPGGPGRDPDVRGPAGRAVRRRRPLHERPGQRPGRAARAARCTTSRSCGSYEIGMSSSHIGSGGMRSKVLCAEMATSAGIPVVICNGTQPGMLLRAVARRAGRDALPSAGAARVELQAVAEVREERARDGAGRPGRRARAARAGHEPAAGRRGRGGGRLRGGRRRRGGRGGRRPAPDRQGDLQLLGRGAAPREGPEVGRRCARCCPARARRPCTATTSCWPERRPRSSTFVTRPARSEKAKLTRSSSGIPLPVPCPVKRITVRTRSSASLTTSV